MKPDQCRGCGGWPASHRLTLSRAVTVDLVFCGWRCLTRWEADEVNRVERVHAEERFVQLAADAIVARHPQAAWLAEHGKLGRTGLTDRALEAAIERLETWLATPMGQG